MLNSNFEIRTRLRELHEQLSRLINIDPETARLLRVVGEDIDDVLDPKSPATASPELLERWRNTILEFEGRHPHLTQTVDQIGTALANIGL